MRWIYLSTHLDDAVFSVGGLICEQAQAGIPVEIWTLMCGYPAEASEDLSPFAQLLHRQWGALSAEEASRIRREEDEHAAAVLGAGLHHFDFLDCIYRRGAHGEWLYSEVFVPPDPADAGIPAQVAEAIRAHLRPDDVLVCQLALGSHVDHVLVRQGAELLGRPLYYYADVPYIFYRPEELEPKSAGIKESTHLITEAGLERWKDASLEYKSQVPTLREAFNTPEKVRNSLQSYWAEREGIRLWQSI
ncbi:MAG TPA: PIG-L family deacetylase [Anaerolineales bacterium]|nr:PIG-L family deacetylase [Anaerolineales bacterium]